MNTYNGKYFRKRTTEENIWFLLFFLILFSARQYRSSTPISKQNKANQGVICKQVYNGRRWLYAYFIINSSYRVEMYQLPAFIFVYVIRSNKEKWIILVYLDRSWILVHLVFHICLVFFWFWILFKIYINSWISIYNIKQFWQRDSVAIPFLYSCLYWDLI